MADTPVAKKGINKMVIVMIIAIIAIILIAVVSCKVGYNKAMKDVAGAVVATEVTPEKKAEVVKDLKAVVKEEKKAEAKKVVTGEKK